MEYSVLASMSHGKFSDLETDESDFGEYCVVSGSLFCDIYEYTGDVYEYDGDVHEYDGDVHEYGGDVYEYVGDTHEYNGDLGE